MQLLTSTYILGRRKHSQTVFPTPISFITSERKKTAILSFPPQKKKLVTKQPMSSQSISFPFTSFSGGWKTHDCLGFPVPFRSNRRKGVCGIVVALKGFLKGFFAVQMAGGRTPCVGWCGVMCLGRCCELPENWSWRFTSSSSSVSKWRTNESKSNGSVFTFS